MKERRNAIVEFINQEGNISFAQLKAAFPDVSEMTLRTDLKALDQEHRIIRVHGGARSVEFVVGTDDLLGARKTRNVDAKRQIAAAAAKLVRPNSTIFLDSGSTTTMLAAALPDVRSFIFTTSISCANELARLEVAQPIILGGRLNRFSLSTYGSRTSKEIEGLSFDIAFIGATAFSAEAGFTCGSDEEASLKRTCIQSAEQVVVLMDPTKIGRRSTFSVCNLDAIDTVVTTEGISAEFRELCKDNDVGILTK